jgi:uncharacterized protein
MNNTIKKNNAVVPILKAILFCIVFTCIFILLSFFKFFISNKFERMAHGVVGTIAAFITTWLFLKFEKKTFSDIGLKIERGTLIKFCVGVLFGVALMGVLTFSVIFFSDFKVERNNKMNMLSFLIGAFPLIPLAFMEEMGFRAYALQVLKENSGVRSSIIITAVLFALYHIANGWTIQNSFLGAGVWGIIFGLAAVYSNGIAMPTGLHFAANITTATFGTTEGAFNFWVLKSSNELALNNVDGSQLATLMPQIGLLLFAIICMEWYLHNKIAPRV